MTIKFNNVYVENVSTVAGPFVIEGPLKDNFDNNSFIEKDNKWLSERYGEEVDHVLSNVYDGKTNTMQLPKTTECNEAISDNIISATVSNNNLYANYDIMHNDINNILYENNVPFVFNILSNKEVNINNEVNKIVRTDISGYI